MADTKSMSKPLRELNSRYESGIIKMCDRIGSHLTQRDVCLLTILSGTGIDATLKRKIKNGKDLLLALTRTGYCDESNLTSIIDLMKIIKRHDLLHMIHMKKKTKGNKVFQ
ncbi:death effector domain-containing protein [Nephila pilipes]|uniref:Death effector domain-containing protein n=1 Tax=Nephila pilipes TaxID=299642 RepID=A0A8X6NL96_NEPPI|nr:death effector domain-containing protein [Nephila pilipes]